MVIAELFDQALIAGHALKHHLRRDLPVAEVEALLERGENHLQTLVFLLQASPQLAKEAMAGRRHAFIHMRSYWPADAPPAGYVGEGNDLDWLSVFRAMSAMWHLELRGSGGAATRLLRAGLYMAHEHGEAAAIDYLIDLVRSLPLLAGSTLGQAAYALLQAIDRYGAREAYRFCRRRRPSSFEDWLNLEEPLLAPLAQWKQPSESFQQRLAGFYQRIYLECIACREARTVDAWFVGQYVVSTLSGAIRYIRQVHAPPLGIGLRAIDDDLEEFCADAFSFQFQRSGDHHDYHDFPFLMWFAGAEATRKGYEVIGAEDPHRLVLDRRILVPSLLTDIWLRSHSEEGGAFEPLIDAALPDWRLLSPKTAAIFGPAVLRAPDGVQLYRRDWPPPNMQDLLRTPEIQAGLAEQLSSAVLREIVGLRLAGNDEAINLLLVEQVPEPLQDQPPDPALFEFARYAAIDRGRLADLCRREGVACDRLSTALRQAYFGCSALELREAAVAAAIRAEALDVSAEALIGNLLARYPYYAPLHAELAIFCDRTGRHEEARSHIVGAIMLDPASWPAWQILAVISRNLGARQEEVLAYAGLAELLERLEAKKAAG